MNRIVSGGQTGVDRGALDAALERAVDVGGWCPRGRRAEDGSIHARYPLRETPTAEYAERTRWNVRDSDGTLILVFNDQLSGGTALTQQLAAALGRPVHVADARDRGAVGRALRWALSHEIQTLNVAGPRESEAPGIYDHAKAWLGALLDAYSS